MVNSLNDTTIKSINSLIGSINSLISINNVQNIATSIAAIAAAVSTIILFLSFRSQSKIMTSELKHYQANIKKLKETHYQEFREKLREIINKNSEFLCSGVIDMEFGSGIKIYFNINELKQIITSHFTDIHLNNDIPNFSKILNEISILVETLDKKVDNNKIQIINIIEQRLSEFDLVSNQEPRIYYYLRKYWYRKIIALEKGENMENYNSKIRKIEEDYGYQSDLDYEQDDCCRFGGDAIFRKTKSTDREKFFKIVNELIKDKEIWDMYDKIASMRKQIINQINNCNTLINNIVIQIDKKQYNTEYSCCPFS